MSTFIFSGVSDRVAHRDSCQLHPILGGPSAYGDLQATAAVLELFLSSGSEDSAPVLSLAHLPPGCLASCQPAH